MALLQQATACVAGGELPHAQGSTVAGSAVWRDLWHSRHGVIRIEVVDNVCYVNGDRVDPPPSAGPVDGARHAR